MEPALSLKTLEEKLVERYFSDEWVTKFNVVDPPSPEVQPLLINTLSKIAIDIVDFFTLFLLSGEYCHLDFEKWDTDAQRFKRFIENQSFELESLQAIHGDFAYKAQDYFISNIIKPFDDLINPFFSYLYKDLETQLTFKEVGTTFRLEKVVNLNQWDGGIRPYFAVFRIASFIVDLEHFKYSFSERILADLILSSKELEDISINNFNIDALKCKINFLVRKLIYRAESQKKKEKFSYSYSHTEDKILSIENNTLTSSLGKWDNVIQVHYGFTHNYKNEQRKRARLLQDNGAPVDYTYFHAIIKIYKDDSQSIEQIKNLLQQYKDYSHPNTLSFDRFAKAITYNYLFNNQISLKIEKEDINNPQTRENFKSYFFDIKNFQNQTFVYNYFPWEKLCQILSDKIDYLSNDLLNEKKFQLFEALTEVFSDTLKKFEEAFWWSKRKNLLHFQLNFSDCKSDYVLESNGYGNFNLFFFSSFVIPIDYVSEQKNLSDLQLKKIKFETLSTTYKKLKTVVEEVNDTSDRLRNSERRSIEILAIFSAISLFSVGSIQILTNEAVGRDPLLFYKIVMSFGYCLLLFVLAIWIITRNNLKEIHWYHWLLMTILIATSGVVIGNFTESALSNISVKPKVELHK